MPVSSPWSLRPSGLHWRVPASMELAGYIASQVGVADLAKQFYAKAEQKMSAAPERLKLAEAVIKDTGDKEYAGEVYGRAAESLTQPNDLMSVAANVADQLGDKTKTTSRTIPTGLRWSRRS